MSSRLSIQPIALSLKASRIAKKLSQHELGRKSDMPQSHISNIESGRVDLTTSSLIELARALELELMLIPRSLAPTVRSLLRTSSVVAGKRGPAPFGTADQAPVSPAYSLDDDDDESN